MDVKHEKNWEQMIRVFILFFKWLIISETDYPAFCMAHLIRSSARLCLRPHESTSIRPQRWTSRERSLDWN
jgi:hypothetical protein